MSLHDPRILNETPEKVARATRRMVAIALFDLDGKAISQPDLATKLGIPEDIVRARLNELQLVGWATVGIGPNLTVIAAISDEGRVQVQRATKDVTWTDPGQDSITNR